ncbi:hypothetical protein CBS101457_002338 [Exobasidium rhododendri]|nr:hypothetical protein CBS101457_002338 [Exobasidium rhododendri]
MKTGRARLAEAYEGLLEECRLELYLHRYPHIALEAIKEGGTKEEARSLESETTNTNIEGEEDEVLDDVVADMSSEESDEHDEEEDDDDEEEEEEGEEEEEEEEEDDDDGYGYGEGRYTASMDADEPLDAWTEAELAMLFPSLARRSRFFPDLISRDLNHSKSTSQVALYLSQLKAQSDLQEEDSLARSLRNQTHTSHPKAERASRRIARLSVAHEMSAEWLEFEETQAATLGRWEDLDDAEERREGSHFASAADELEIGAMIREQEGVVSWDSQVTNALLYLRHAPSTCPSSNDVNFFYEIPLAASSDLDSVELFSFPVSSAVRLLTCNILHNEELGQSQTQSYSAFSAIHPTPDTHKGTDEQRRELAWRIVYRGVELGLCAWVELTERRGSLPRGKILNRIYPPIHSTHKNLRHYEQGMLVWPDTMPHSEGSANARLNLEVARQLSRGRLLNTLLWKEVSSINTFQDRKRADQRSEKGKADQPASSSPRPSTSASNEGDDFFKGFDLSIYPDLPERKRAKIRIIRRIERYGEEIALSMPVDAQQKGRKRKVVEVVEVLSSSSRKRRKLQESGDDGDEADNEDESGQEEGDVAEEEEGDVSRRGGEGIEGAPLEANRTPVRLTRLEQIGIAGERLSSLLPVETRESLDLFNINTVNKMALRLFEPHEGERLQGISQHVFPLMAGLLRKYLRAIISSTNDAIASSVNVKGDSRLAVGAEQVHMAVLQSRLTRPGEVPRRWRKQCSLDHFRSDPPCLYPVEGARLQGLKVQLEGLRSMNASSTLSTNEQHSSITNDATISASDSFITPISSIYLRRKSPAGSERDCATTTINFDGSGSSSEEEGSLYDDSDQEREIQMRRDERRGVMRDTARVDGRVWAFNERRQNRERQRWEKLEEADAESAVLYEERLWVSLGMKPKQDRLLHERGGDSDRALGEEGEDDDEDKFSSSEEDEEEEEEGGEEEEEEEEEESVNNLNVRADGGHSLA